MLDPITVALFAGILFFFVCIGLTMRATILKPRASIETRAAVVGRRLRDLAGARRPGNPNELSAKRTDASRTPLLDRLVLRFLPRKSMLKDRLARTGRNISVGAYGAINVILLGLVFLVAFRFGGLSWFISLAIGIAAGIGLPHKFVGWQADRRTKAFNDIFPDAIDLMVRGLRSGLPVTESLASVGQEMADPVGHEFRLVADAIKFGTTMDKALWDASDRLGIQEFKFFVISLSVQKETGGNLAETLANLSDILRRRHQMRLKIKAMSSEARASAMILGSLPFIMFGIIFLLNNDYAMDLFTDPRGRSMLVGVLLIMGMGILVMRKMVRFEI
ncbi:MAG: type II secretion system F family protein [Rhodospirillales bacterium]